MDDQFSLHRLQHRYRQIGEGLPLGHHCQLDIGGNAEQRDVATEVAVLSRVVDLQGEFEPPPRRRHEGRELEILGSGAEHDGDAGRIYGRHVALTTWKRDGPMPEAHGANPVRARSRTL